MTNWEQLWSDQEEFQRLLGKVVPDTFAARTAETKEMVLHLFSECDELLRACGAWKEHRRVQVLENKEHVKEELIDVFKYWLIMCQIQGFTPSEMIDAYWAKSMAVRQRFSEEWVQQLVGPAVLIDVDNVLADYINGFLSWAVHNGYLDIKHTRDRRRFQYIEPKNIGLTAQAYEKLKHQFRTSTQHRFLPPMPGARQFMMSVRQMGVQIIVLTSRPIDRYPNLHGDTIHWLKMRDIPYDYIWWAADKGNLTKSKLPSNAVLFAVDDEWKYVNQLREIGIRTFWFRPGEERINAHNDEVSDFFWLMRMFEKEGVYVRGQGTSTPCTTHRIAQE